MNRKQTMYSIFFCTFAVLILLAIVNKKGQTSIPIGSPQGSVHKEAEQEVFIITINSINIALGVTVPTIFNTKERIDIYASGNTLYRGDDNIMFHQKNPSDSIETVILYQNPQSSSSACTYITGTSILFPGAIEYKLDLEHFLESDLVKEGEMRGGIFAICGTYKFIFHPNFTDRFAIPNIGTHAYSPLNSNKVSILYVE